MDIQALLAAFKEGSIDGEETARQIRAHFFTDLGHTVLDTDRARRTGSPEVIFGAGKSAGQISDIVGSMVEQGSSVLVTRLDQATFNQLECLPADTEYHPMSQLLWWHQSPPAALGNTIAVVSAGTSDMHVAEEAALTAEFYGNTVERIYDVGVAGLHRLLARLDDLRSARVLIVVAGMEGALPSVVGGLVDKPIIAVPTSVGYGAAFDGVAALLGMMTSCASGVSGVNIDNGFGAGFLANRINRL
ncbi:MAG: nickel pincer cofactor biosynthesis protein LarB [Proteobacteria bacterium]|nr:nickel pincer cofactor biosynthesis protein LarB [Pseudomonadota bacterium]